MTDNWDWFEKMESQALVANSEAIEWMNRNPAFKGEVQCISHADYEHLCKWAEDIDNLGGFSWPGPLPKLHPETEEGYVVPWTQLLDRDDEAPELESGELDPDTGEWTQPYEAFTFQRFVSLQAEKVNGSTKLDWVQRRMLYIYGDYSKREWSSCAKYWMRTIDGKVDAVGILKEQPFSLHWQTFKPKFNADCRGPLVGLQDGFAPWLSLA
jgi:hypothetical protein